MQGHLFTDYGKMGHGALRYLSNEIVAVIDSENSGKNIKDCLEFKIDFGNKTFFFHYNLNSKKKIHSFNSINLITRKDVLSNMIKDVLNEKVDFKNNKNKSLFANKLIDKIIKKI